MSETAVKQQWICGSCGFIYDPDEGDPDGGIPPGTAFEDIPDDWFCPVCGARKRDFEPYDGEARPCRQCRARRMRTRVRAWPARNSRRIVSRFLPGRNLIRIL